MQIRLLRFSFFITIVYFITGCDLKKTDDPSPTGNCLPLVSYQTSPATLSHGDRYAYEYDEQGRPVKISFGQLYSYIPDTTGKYLISYNSAGQLSQIQAYGDQTNVYIDPSLQTYTFTYNNQGQLEKGTLDTKFQVEDFSFLYDNTGRCIQFLHGNSLETNYQYFGDTLITASQTFHLSKGQYTYPMRIDSFSYYSDKENRLQSLQTRFFPDVFTQYVGNNNHLNNYQGFGIRFPLSLFTPPFQHKKMLKRWITANAEGGYYQPKTSLRADYTYEYNAQGWPIKQKATYQHFLPEVIPAYTVEAIMEYPCD